VDGRVDAVTLEPGAAVRKGDVGARMDLADLQDAAREALALVTAMSNTVSAAAARIRAAEAQESLSKWIWDAQSKIYANSGISAETLKENERDYVAAQVDTEQARFTWNAMGALWALSRLSPIYFERRLKWAVMTSPIDGIVLNRYHENAATLMAGAPLLDIGNPDELEVTAGILSEDATAIKPGAEVDIFGTALGTNTLQGRVKRVDPRAFMKVSSLGVEEQRVNVTVAIKAGELARLRAGGRELGVDFRVRVRIYTAAAPDAVMVPVTALFRANDGQWSVFAVRGRRAELVNVQLGLINDEQAQIVDGLRPGEWLIVAPDLSMASGRRVKAQRES